MNRTIRVEDAVGTTLAHDITEIRAGETKGPAFKRGHVVCDDDVCHLKRLGKNNLYQLDIKEDQLHEDDAARILADALMGPGVYGEDNPSEGKINIYAAHDGLLQVDAAALTAFNLVDQVMAATLHTNTPVHTGELVAATRAIPLVIERTAVEKAASAAQPTGHVVSVAPLKKAKAGLVITGSEIYNGLIQDKFAPILKSKVEELGSTAARLEFAPDDAEHICRVIKGHLEAGCDLILLSGGMSVDPDDVTRQAVRMAGATELYYGASVLPGAMFLTAYIDTIPVLGVPACGMYFARTVLDLILPRVLAGQHIGRSELALLGHGGLCRNCVRCQYPVCPFGKGV